MTELIEGSILRAPVRKFTGFVEYSISRPVRLLIVKFIYKQVFPEAIA